MRHEMRDENLIQAATQERKACIDVQICSCAEYERKEYLVCTADCCSAALLHCCTAALLHMKYLLLCSDLFPTDRAVCNFL
mmetsp:Transcript_6259/g.15420  ORF Transcript_6259/g.15420 Transcript_6259/m.15420 type:complete len:81 (-) Transcript_6259:227-469(-)